MTVSYAPSPLVYPATIPIPTKGGPMNGEAFAAAFRAVADAAEWVRSRQARDRADVQFRRVMESLLNPQQRWMGGTANEKIRGPFTGVAGRFYVGLEKATSRKLLHSADGLSYEVKDFGGGANLWTIVRKYADDKVLAVTSDGASYLATVSVGSPPTTWTAGTLGLPGGESIEHVARLIDSTRVIAISGPSNYVFTSDDGITWTNAGIATIEANARVVAVTSGYTTDGGTPLFALALGTKRGASFPTWYPSSVVYVGNAGATIWTPQTVPNAKLGFDIKYTGIADDSAFLLAGEAGGTDGNGVWRSGDAQTWTPAWNDHDLNATDSFIIRSPYGQLVTLGINNVKTGSLYYRERHNWGGKLPGLDSVLGRMKYAAYVDAGNGQALLLMDAITSAGYAAIYSGHHIAPAG